MSGKELSAGKNAGGNNQSKEQSADKPSDQGDNDFPPADADQPAQTGFSHFLRNVVIAGVFATGIWVVGEQFHNQGYLQIGNAANCIACVVFFTVAPFEAMKHWRRPVVIWLLYVIFLVMPLLFVFFGLKAKIESNPYPHLSFMILDPETQSPALELTNDLMVVKRFGTNVNWPTAHILFPIKWSAWTNKQEFLLQFGVKNNGPIMAQHSEAVFLVSSNISFEPESGWSPARYEYSPRSWAIKLPEILAGNGTVLPAFHLRNIPMEVRPGAHSIYFSIVARDNSGPAQAVAFAAIFLLVNDDSTNDSPVLVNSRNIDGNEVFPVPFPYIEKTGD